MSKRRHRRAGTLVGLAVLLATGVLADSVKTRNDGTYREETAYGTPPAFADITNPDDQAVVKEFFEEKSADGMLVLAVTVHDVEASVKSKTGDVAATQDARKRFVAKVTVEEIEVLLKLRTKTYLFPNADTPKVKEHEKGHQELSEQVWQVAVQEAQKKAKEISAQLPKTLEGAGDTLEEALQRLQEALSAFLLDVGAQVKNVAQTVVDEANERYDAVTGNGSNSKESEEAVKEIANEIQKKYNGNKPK